MKTIQYTEAAAFCGDRPGSEPGGDRLRPRRCMSQPGRTLGNSSTGASLSIVLCASN